MGHRLSNIICRMAALPGRTSALVEAIEVSFNDVRDDAERGSRYLTVKAVAAGVPAGRAPEFWMLPEGRAPVSIGLVPATGIERLQVRAPADVAPQGIPVLAVGIEPPGGSPTGGPTGPVVYTGPRPADLPATIDAGAADSLDGLSSRGR